MRINKLKLRKKLTIKQKEQITHTFATVLFIVLAVTSAYSVSNRNETLTAVMRGEQHILKG